MKKKIKENWISVKDGFPDAERIVLIWDGIELSLDSYSWQRKPFNLNWMIRGRLITHWMELPKPPKGGKDGK